MIDFGIKYQLSVFGHFEEILPEPKIISKLLDIFSSYPLIPGTYNEIVVGSNAISQKLKLSNQAGDLIVFFTKDRIDIEKSATKSNKNTDSNSEEYKEFIEQGKDILTKVLTAFDKKVSRIAIVDNFLLKELSDEKINRIFSNIFSLKNNIGSKPKVEWSFRVANRDLFKFGNSEEDINIILSLNLIQGKIVHNNVLKDTHNRFLLNIDINTLPEKTEDRFDSEAVLNFYKEILMYKENWINDFITQLNK